MKTKTALIFIGIVFLFGLVYYLFNYKNCEVSELERDMPSSFKYNNVLSTINEAKENGFYVAPKLRELAEYYCIDTSDLKKTEEIING